MKLPEQYRAKDRDKDNQIGLYEWDRKDYATFRKLDLNHDGYLTADELTRKPSSGASPAVAAAKLEPPGRAAGPTSSPPSSGTGSSKEPAADGDAASAGDKPAAPAGEGVAAAAAPPSAAGRTEAEKQWELVDKDKDGKVTEAEWGRSFLTRLRFQKAGIAVTFPMTQEEFLQLYSQLPSSGN
jgi:hypothetical protein